MAVKSGHGKSPHLSPDTLAGLQERLQQPSGFKSYGQKVAKASKNISL
ncbi:MAG TPA: hypothetical protein VK211_28660 [Kamptonema sp.]|nr:hypothetical protein [Kamptonema sp.]